MAAARILGRYELHDAFASGGMAQVHLGRLAGPGDFQRIVAIKRLHASHAGDPGFRAMLVDEARLAGSIRHVNVVSIIEVLEDGDEIFVVMEFIEGEVLSRLMRESRARGARIPMPISAALMLGILNGLHAAHEATDAAGAPLGLVHRDLSPQNVVVGLDGVPRILDFGIAKALGRVQSTTHGEVKGKAGYMAPEQIRGKTLDRRVDLFAAGIVLWEMLSGARLYDAENGAASMMRVLELVPEAPGLLAGGGTELDAIALRALEHAPEARFATAKEMAEAIEHVATVAPVSEVAAWVAELASATLRTRLEEVRLVRSAPISPVDAVVASAAGLPVVPKRRRVLPFVAAGVLGVVAAGIALARTRHAPPPDAVVIATPVPASAPPPSAVATPPLPATTPNATAIATARTSGAHSAARVVPHPPAAKPGGCKPPYTVDADGIHVMKPECM